MRLVTPGSQCVAFVLFYAFAFSGCALLPASAPTVAEVVAKSQAGASYSDAKEFLVVDLDKSVVSTAARLRSQGFYGTFKDHGPPPELRIAVGDLLQISVIEVGGGLFGQGNNAATLGSEVVSAQTTALQPVSVPPDGYINVPYAGRIHAAGQTADQVRQEIEHLLAAKALTPQSRFPSYRVRAPTR